MSLWTWLNARRLRDYPRLVLIASSIVLLLNLLLHRGWIGGLTGLLMWGDYIVYYAGGILYKTDITHIYDPAIQEITQRNLISPTVPPGVTLYSYPPNAAFVHAGLSYLSLPFSLVIWCVISIFCIFAAAKLMHRFILPERLARNGLSVLQLSLVMFSSFAFIEGFAAGQMHSITLILMVAIVIATMKEKWLFAGLLAAALTYKPQFVIAFILIWLIWKKFYAILSFILFSSIWFGIVLITKGIAPFLGYATFVNNMVYLPYVKEGFPSSVLATPYTFIASMLPFHSASLWNQIFYGIVFFGIIAFGIFIYKFRNYPISNQYLVLSMGLLFPLIFTPYGLLHDLIILFPVMILIAVGQEHNRNVLLISIGIYLAMLLLPLLSVPIKIALTGLIPMAVLVVWIQRAIIGLRGSDLQKTIPPETP